MISADAGNREYRHRADIVKPTHAFRHAVQLEHGDTVRRRAKRNTRTA